MSIQSAMSNTYSSVAQAASSVKNTVVNHKKEVAILFGLAVTAGVVYAGYQHADTLASSIKSAYDKAAEYMPSMPSYESIFGTSPNIDKMTATGDSAAAGVASTAETVASTFSDTVASTAETVASTAKTVASTVGDTVADVS